MTIRLGFHSPAAGARVGRNFTVTGFAFDDGKPMPGDPPGGRVGVSSLKVAIGTGAGEEAARSGADWSIPGTLPSNVRGGDPVTVTATCQGTVTFDDAPGENHPFSVDATLRVLAEQAGPAGTTENTADATVTPDAVAPPALSIDEPFNTNVPGSPLPAVFTLTGGTNGSEVGVTGVRYSVPNGPSGPAENTGPGGDWKTWRARIPLPSTGTFPITVTASDFLGRTAVGLVTVMVLEPPTVTLDPFDADVTVTSLPFQLILTGETLGAPAGILGVRYAVANGPSGAAVDSAADGDWSTWRAQIPLPTTGTFPVTITASNSAAQNGTGTVNVDVQAAPPTVTLDPFDADVTVTSLPFPFVLTGEAFGALAEITGVRYAVTDGPSGPADGTGPGGAWSTWHADIPLPTTGTFAIAVTATDSLGHTGTASGSVRLRL
ncbi:hypothetical protein ACGF3G_36450 [Streptomyces sp. NPDC048179]|uniref:hypothetical protein n=1 Tax=Streptomyces sp. NPDC048179 TaxID=3365506 RepID=UPI0037106BF5